MNQDKKRGFTLIELLVVVAIIGILSAILFISINPQEKIKNTKAISIVNDLKSIETAFKYWSYDNNFSPYPTEDELGLGSNPTIKTLIDNDVLKILPDSLNAKYLSDGIYKYDNDGDHYSYLDNCPGVPDHRGVNIYISNVSEIDEIGLELDKIIDNSDGLNCGKIRRYDPHSSFMYNISVDG